jgi:hypothetical protein
VSYKEIVGSNGCIFKEWRNELDMYHREDGPAYIEYSSDGSSCTEEFWIHGQHLGYKHNGFWSLWGRLTDEQRKHPNILKCLARYS